METPLPARRSNRPVTPLHVIEYGLLQALFALFRLIGVDASSALAGKYLRAVGPLIGPVSKRADDNLKAVFPEMPKRQRAQIIAGVWENLGRTTAEFAHLDKFHVNAADKRIELAGIEELRAIAREGRQVIFVSGHFANWELMAIALHQAGVKTALVYRAANNPLVDEMIIKARGRVMSRVQIPKGKRGGRDLIDALKDERSLALLVDQKLNDGISVPFLGRAAMTAPAAARLSLKFNLPIITGSVERLGGAHFRLTMHEPIDFTPSGDIAEDIRALTILVNEQIECDIRARPEQWLWLHRRWSPPRQKKNKR